MTSRGWFAGLILDICPSHFEKKGCSHIDSIQSVLDCVNLVGGQSNTDGSK